MSGLVRSIGLVACLGVLGLGAMTIAAQADATSVLKNCKYNSRQKTINCCNFTIKKFGKPLWMRQSGGSCAEVVQCARRNGPVRCFVEIIQDRDIGRGRDSGNSNNRGGRP